MTFGKKQTRILLLCAAALVFTAGPGPLPGVPVAHAASEVAVVVNKMAITTGDVAKRAAFLRLQHRKGDLKKM
ncbi:MAG: peptidylprolyl isomerase, partial [Rhizobiaceae bacterium]|nr:peptidylprolyl isomerase [Rhizobiaceae bacterium]